MKARRQYDFPNATIVILENGKCKEIPKWCPHISVDRDRKWVASALVQLRAFQKVYAN